MVTLIIFSSIVCICYGQDDLETVLKSLRKSHKGSLKILKSSSDSTGIVIGYKKSTHELLGVQILVRRAFIDPKYPTVSQYAFYFMPGDTVLLKIISEHSDGRHIGRALYVFKGSSRVLKDENKHVKSDYSDLFGKCEYYKQLAFQRIKEKFGD